MNEYLKAIYEYKNIPYLEAFHEALYYYYKSENFEPKSIYNLGEEINIKPSILKTYINSYVSKKLNMDKETFLKYRLKEREKNKDLFLGIPNIILKEEGIETKYLWTSEEEKKLFLKKLYIYSMKNNFSEEFVQKMSEQLGITKIRYQELLVEYMEKYYDENDFKEELKTGEEKQEETEEKVKKPKNEIKKEIIENRQGDLTRERNLRLRSVYEKIMSVEDVEKESNLIIIEKTIEESGYNITHLKSNFELYKKLYTEEQAAAFQKNYDAYRVYRTKRLKEKREELKREKQIIKLEKEIDKAKEIISSYIDCVGISFVGFLANNNITKDKFNEYVESVKLYDKKLFKEYLEQKTKKEKEFEIGLEDELIELGYRLENGFEENGKKRKFDIIDYYNITSIPLSNIINIASKKLNRKQLYELKKLKTGFLYSDKYNSSEEKAILEEKRIIGVKFDNNGKMIEGSGREITIEEKMNIINYLKQINLSVNRMTYNAVFKRYIDGFINFESKELVLKPDKK